MPSFVHAVDLSIFVSLTLKRGLRNAADTGEFSTPSMVKTEGDCQSHLFFFCWRVMVTIDSLAHFLCCAQKSFFHEFQCQGMADST